MRYTASAKDVDLLLRLMCLWISVPDKARYDALALRGDLPGHKPESNLKQGERYHSPCFSTMKSILTFAKTLYSMPNASQVLIYVSHDPAENPSVCRSRFLLTVPLNVHSLR